MVHYSLAEEVPSYFSSATDFVKILQSNSGRVDDYDSC